MDPWRVHVDASAVLFNERFEACRHSIELAHYVGRPVSGNGNELVEMGISFDELLENQTCHLSQKKQRKS